MGSPLAQRRARRDAPAIVAGVLRSAFHARLRVATRDSGLIAGVIALVAFPAWSLFDLLLLPDRAASFIHVRVIFEVGIAIAFAGLWWKRTGTRWPEVFAFTILALPEVAIAWMIPRSEPRLEAYLLGFSLAIYASAFVIVWRWHITALLFGCTAVSTTVCVATANSHLRAADIATIGFYLATAGAIAIASQIYRYRSGWKQFVIESALEVERQRNEELVAELERMTREDELTGIANRRAWDEWLLEEFRRARRTGTTMAVMLCDFDHLKDVNDRFGHHIGDQALRVGANVLMSRVRETDIVARLGGDEFAIGCPATTGAEAYALARELLDRAHDTRWPNRSAVTFSLGVAELKDDDQSALDVVRRADAALYLAKITRDSACNADALVEHGRAS